MNEKHKIVTRYPLLSKLLIEEKNNNLKYQLDRLNLTQKHINKEISKGNDMYNQKTPEEILNYMVRWVLDKRYSYKGTYEEQKQKTIIALNRKYTKQLNKELSKLDLITESKQLPNRLTITIEWKRSYMWGSNPNASDNYGNNSGSIGGCGYDKLSTATARILNQHLYLIKLMCDFKEKYLNSNIPIDNKPVNNNSVNRVVLGYGSGYSIIPRFEGGVGVSCHETILSKLGYKMEQIVNSNNTDVFIIEPIN